jgi:hypothetical protein
MLLVLAVEARYSKHLSKMHLAKMSSAYAVKTLHTLSIFTTNKTPACSNSVPLTDNQLKAGDPDLETLALSLSWPEQA